MGTRPRTILIADPNPHVRRFLQREMMSAGYDVAAARSLSDLLGPDLDSNAIGLIIVDPDFPDISGHDLLNRLSHRVPGVPIILHTHDSPPARGLEPGIALSIVEKRGNSIERIKQLADQWLKGPVKSNRGKVFVKEERNGPKWKRT
jgi:DNA-binding NtrC family response regulator